MKSKSVNTKESLFPTSLFGVFLLVLLLMSGVHTGLLVGMDALGWNKLVQTIVPILYWSAVAIGLTLYTRRKIQNTYEVPMQRLAQATQKVAAGDFSVYVAPIHTPDKADYIDRMIVDFNTMVEELGSIETLKTDFFSNVSHEFKTPLAVIQSNAELLQKGLAPTDEHQEQVGNILSATRRLANLIMNMLKLNKLEKQTIRPAAEVYDVCAQLCSVAVQFEDAWERKDIEFDADLEDAAYVQADPGLLELVWTNLLSNAVKFTPQGGSITLRQTRADGKIYVSVTDTGCGMDEKTVKHIYDKFYQGDTSHSTEGNGLGMALVKRILELTGADIQIESTPGKGSTFTVVLNQSTAQ